LTILSQYVCGLYPLEPAWKTFQVRPQLGGLKQAETGNKTLAGNISIRVEQDKSNYTIDVNVPEGTEAIVYISLKKKKVKVDGIEVFRRKAMENDLAVFEGEENGYNLFRVGAGTHKFVAQN
jgi:hypothetical protein